MKGMLKAIAAIIIAMAIIGILLGARAEAENAQWVCVVRKGEWVWVRDTPSKDGNKIDTIRYGYDVTVSEIVNMYAHITWLDGTKEGWADVSYLEMPIQEEIWVINTKDPVNKRETPEGRYLTKIKGGSRISVLGWRYSKSGELWARVYHGGYVKACYLSKAD